MQFEIVEYEAPAAPPHPYQANVQAILDAGEGKVARATGTEEELESEKRKFQDAARQMGYSARVRSYGPALDDDGNALTTETEDDGTVPLFTIAIAVGAQIKRPRKDKTEDAPVEEAAPTPAPAKTSKK